MHKKMNNLFFVSIAWPLLFPVLLAIDGMLADANVPCPSNLPEQEFKVCVSEEINRIWKGSRTQNFTEFNFLAKSYMRFH